MAHQIIDVEEHQKEPIAKRFETKIHTITRTILPPFIDSLILLNIAVLYFFFTGMAILLKRELPREWLKIATHLTRGKVAKKIKDMGEEQEEKPQRTVKVVDLETGQNMLSN